MRQTFAERPLSGTSRPSLNQPRHDGAQDAYDLNAVSRMRRRPHPATVLRYVLLATAAVFFVLHFFHLRADFPNDSPWMDWSKYTDEGWYGDAAIRHYLFGHWYFKGDFNPAVALPVWPLMEAAVFRFTGVSVVAARALTLMVFAAMLLGMYALLQRFPGAEFHDRGDRRTGPPLAGPLAVLFFCVSPFFYVFERMAILEPLLAALTTLAMLTAAYTPRPLAVGAPTRARWRLWGSHVLLGLLIVAMVLTKTTAVALLPAVLYLLWDRAGYRLRPAMRLALPPLLIAGVLWAGYLFVLVRPHYKEDYDYLFSANAYTGIQLEPLATVLYNTFVDGHWIGIVLYAAFWVGLVLAIFLRPHFFRNPIVPALLLWVAGYFAFLAYHNNLQPRYYLMVAVPITALLALVLDDLRQVSRRPGRAWSDWVRGAAVAAVVLGVTIPDAIVQLGFVRHPEYTFEDAAQAIARVVRANPNHSDLILSISGSDLTLMTGLPSIDDDFGTLDLDQRVKQYRPGWYVAWNQLDDDKMDALTPLFHPVRVATFDAMDDPERNQLILYRLDPGAVARHRRTRPRPPHALRTKLGQQPTTEQLQH